MLLDLADIGLMLAIDCASGALTPTPILILVLVISSLSCTERLWLWKNSLTGTIPTQLAGMDKLSKCNKLG